MASASGTASLSGLPFTSSSTQYTYAIFNYVHGSAVDGGTWGGYIGLGNTNLIFIDGGGTAGSTWINGAGKEVMVAGCYTVD